VSNGAQGLAALLRYVAAARDRAIEEIRRKAAAESLALTRAARAKAAAQVRQALAEARADADARIGLARAQSQARARRARHALTAGALQQAWARIGVALVARWQDADARRAWVEATLAQAQRHLPGGAWRIAHPAGWNPAECRAAIEALRAQRAGLAIAFEPGPFDAGLRIQCGPALLDASAAGLLRDRARIEGLWLAELERGKRGQIHFRADDEPRQMAAGKWI